MLHAEQPENLAHIFSLFSSATRIEILQLLKRHPMCVGALATRLGITQGAVSQHLRILRDARLVAADKRGYYVHYCLNSDTFAEYKHAIQTFLTAPASSDSCICAGYEINKGGS